MRVLLGIFVMLLGNAADACRCAERTLAEYYADADEVFVGTLIGVREFAEGQIEFRFDVDGERYKRPTGAHDSLPHVSHSSTAACRVEAEPGAVYVVFAERDTSNGIAWLTSCNGTRMHRSADGETYGFADVPDRFVLSQLAALSGMDVLQRVAAAAPQPGNPDNESMIGLLDIAALSSNASLPLYDAPREAATVVATVDAYEAFEHREYDYEMDAAVAYAQVDGWFKLALTDRRFAWISPEHDSRFMPLEMLLPRRLNYLTAAWSRYLWPEPGAGLPLRLGYEGERRPREEPAAVLDARRIAGSLWLEVEVLRSDPCSGEPGKIRARGWLPAYGEAGTPVAWFYSRGC